MWWIQVVKTGSLNPDEDVIRIQNQSLSYHESKRAYVHDWQNNHACQLRGVGTGFINDQILNDNYFKDRHLEDIGKRKQNNLQSGVAHGKALQGMVEYTPAKLWFVVLAVNSVGLGVGAAEVILSGRNMGSPKILTFVLLSGILHGFAAIGPLKMIVREKLSTKWLLSCSATFVQSVMLVASLMRHWKGNSRDEVQTSGKTELEEHTYYLLATGSGCLLSFCYFGVRPLLKGSLAKRKSLVCGAATLGALAAFLAIIAIKLIL